MSRRFKLAEVTVTKPCRPPHMSFEVSQLTNFSISDSYILFISFLAALAALYLPLSLIHSLIDSLTILNSFQTIPTLVVFALTSTMPHTIMSIQCCTQSCTHDDTHIAAELSPLPRRKWNYLNTFTTFPQFLSFLAALAALYLPWRFIHSFINSLY